MPGWAKYAFAMPSHFGVQWDGRPSLIDAHKASFTTQPFSAREAAGGRKDEHADARVDDLVALKEQGIDLGFSMRIDLQTREPGRPFEMINRSRARNFQVAEGVYRRQNRLDVVADDAPMVRLRQVGGAG